MTTWATYRALRLTSYSEIPLVLALFLFVGFASTPIEVPTEEEAEAGAPPPTDWLDAGVRILVGGILASLLFGLLAVLFFWRGRRDFDESHRKHTQWALGLLFLMGFCLLLAYAQLRGFPTSYSNEDDALAFGGEHSDEIRLNDLKGPVVFLSLVLGLDGTGFWLLTRLHASPRFAWAPWMALGLGWIGAVALFTIGVGAVDDYIQRVGPTAADPAEAESFVRDALVDIVRPWAIGLLLLRLGALPALMSGIAMVRQRTATERAKEKPEVYLAGGAEE